MPIYEYQCGKCGTVTEFIVFGDDENLQCKACHSTDLKKLMSAHNTLSSSPSIDRLPDCGGCCSSPDSCGAQGSCCMNNPHD